MKKRHYIEAIIPISNKSKLINYPVEQYDLALKEIKEIFDNELFDFNG